MTIESIPLIKSVVELLGSIWGFVRNLGGSKGHPDVQIRIPKRSIIVLPNPNPRSSWWHVGSRSGTPAMQIHGEFHVTNVTTYDILLCVAKMRKPAALGHVAVRDSNSSFYGSYVIPPGGTAKLSYGFWVIPPFQEEGESFTTDVAIIDQFGNEHWIRNVQFAYR